MMIISLFFLSCTFTSSPLNLSTDGLTSQTEPLDLTTKRKHDTERPRNLPALAKIRKDDGPLREIPTYIAEKQFNIHKKPFERCELINGNSHVPKTPKIFYRKQNPYNEFPMNTLHGIERNVTQGIVTDPVNKLKFEMTRNMNKSRFETTNPVQSVTYENEQLNDKKTNALSYNEPISSAQRPFQHMHRSDLVHAATETISNSLPIANTHYSTDQIPQSHQTCPYINLYYFTSFKRQYNLEIKKFCCENNLELETLDDTLLTYNLMKIKETSSANLEEIHMTFASLPYLENSNDLKSKDKLKSKFVIDLIVKDAPISVNNLIINSEGLLINDLLPETIELLKWAYLHNIRRHDNIKDLSASYKQFIASTFFTLSGTTIRFKPSLKKILFFMPELLFYLEQKLSAKIDQHFDFSILQSDIELETSKLISVLDAFRCFSQAVSSRNKQSILETNIRDLRKHILGCLQRDSNNEINHVLYTFAMDFTYKKKANMKRYKNSFTLFATALNLDNLSLNEKSKDSILSGNMRSASDVLYNQILMTKTNGTNFFFNLELMAQYLGTDSSPSIWNTSLNLLYLKRPNSYMLFYDKETQKETIFTLKPSEIVDFFYKRIIDIILAD